MATLIGRKNDPDASLAVSDGTHREVLIFRSDQTDIYDQQSDVMASDYFPTPGVTFHSFFTQLVCNQVDLEKDPLSTNIWYVEAEWALNSGDLTGDAGSSPQPQWGDPPERWYPTIRYGSEYRFVNRDAAVTKLKPAARLNDFFGGNVAATDTFILNGDDSEVFYLPVDLAQKAQNGFFTAAGEVYANPGIQIREQVDVIEITRYERDFRINGQIVSYPQYRRAILGCVNSHVFYGAPVRSMLLDDMTAQTVWYGSEAYNQVSYTFKFDFNFPGRDRYIDEQSQSINGGYAMTSSHDPIVLHAGYRQILGGKIKRIIDEDGNPFPTPTPIAPISSWPALITDANGGGVVSGYSLKRGEAYPEDAWSEALDNDYFYLFPFVAQREKLEFDFLTLNLALDLYFPTMFGA